ncbi:hypothetical protein TRP8649_01340 [Pelagimonas phthalicica]|uniref:Subtilase family protein n=2 Tax=Pelagimonas phthalicica TaxID=1037362 RepID=A0A238J9A1_9RHOB|nr:hypothetical protein CLV87_0732 [Pelagimonas phthalicica]SMX27238.1 hypothetical protein TRP8649_01340 [Pelagimonas phthalicica]
MLSFTPLETPAPAPVNLLPAGLPMIVDTFQNNELRQAVYFADTPETLSVIQLQRSDDVEDPFKNLWPSIAGEDELNSDDPLILLQKYQPVSLGHFVPAGGLRLGSQLPFTGDKEDQTAADDIEIGMIDAGISFWNPVAVTTDPTNATKTSRFATIGGLKLENGVITNPHLTPTQIADFVDRSDQQNREEMEKAFPESVFAECARRPLNSPSGSAHGTAMMDLLLRTMPQDKPLHALELPASVLRDLSGGLMSGIMHIAIRALVQQVSIYRKSKELSDRFRMVILMAYGFTGGPQKIRSDVLVPLEKTLCELHARHGKVELVVPIGNHLQDQVHATLHTGEQIGWRIQPEDFSANTLEVVQGMDDPPIEVAAPGGAFAQLPQVLGLHRVDLDGTPIGALWVKDDNGLKRSRLSLIPTATRKSGVATAPFGCWSFSAGRGAADLWVLRDETGFEADPFKPARSSWFEDVGYEKADAVGMPLLEDNPSNANAKLPLVRRKGTASIIATSKHPNVVVVTSQDETGKPANYASLTQDGTAARHAVKLSTGFDPIEEFDLLPIGPFIGPAVLGNASKDRFRGQGTSMAAALKAGELAH